MRNPAPAHAEAASSAWYRQPVLWLGALLFAASLAGCVLMIVLGLILFAYARIAGTDNIEDLV